MGQNQLFLDVFYIAAGYSLQEDANILMADWQL
jgi:hypothetical protein